MFLRKAVSFLMVLALTSLFALPATAKINNDQKDRVIAPLNLAILIQDDLVSRVGNEINVTKEFIRSLPSGSRVMVGYITCLLYTSPSPRDRQKSRMPSSA